MVGAASPHPQPKPSGAITAATLDVAATVVGTDGLEFTGLSYEKGKMSQPLFSGSNSALIGMFMILGKGLLRIGGNSVDKTTWAPTGAGLSSGYVAPSDIDRLAAFAKATGWKVLYGVNMANSTPADAAAEVAYAAEALGESLNGVEVGNEPDWYNKLGYPSPEGFTGWTPSAFLSQWRLFRSAILQEAPKVVLTGPATGNPKMISTWTVPFGQAVGSQDIALLTQHYYRGTAANLITPDPSLVADLMQLAGGATKIGVPFRLTETNSYANGGDQASATLMPRASGRWTICSTLPSAEL